MNNNFKEITNDIKIISKKLCPACKTKPREDYFINGIHLPIIIDDKETHWCKKCGHIFQTK